jgi:hypothetical protein
MALQLEARETLRLVEELSQRTGEDAETVVQVALRERMARLRTPEQEAERQAEIDALVKQLQAIVKESGVPVEDPGELLYGDNGLPR